MSNISISQILSIAFPFVLGEEETSECPDNRHRLSDENIEIVLTEINNPSGDWADYNRIWKYYRGLKRNTNNRTGILCNDDLPPEPDVNDYPIGS